MGVGQRGQGEAGKKSAVQNPQARGAMIRGKLVAAARAVNVGGAHRHKAASAACCELVVALRAEMEIALYMRFAGWAPGDLWLA